MKSLPSRSQNLRKSASSRRALDFSVRKLLEPASKGIDRVAYPPRIVEAAAVPDVRILMVGRDPQRSLGDCDILVKASHAAERILR